MLDVGCGCDVYFVGMVLVMTQDVPSLTGDTHEHPATARHPGIS